MSTLSRLCFTPSALALALAAALLTPVAQANIVYSPQSIVTSQDGTYITDTVNNLDWYKFSNAQTTVGLSLNAVTALFDGTGWSLASLAQVHGLQSQFGWSADTLTASGNANYGLTAAMAGYLGFTASFYVQDGDYLEFDQSIQAMTGDGMQNQFFTTLSLTSSYPDYNFFFGDYVNGMYGLQDPSAAVSGVGTWLSRVHVAQDGGGGGGGTADPDCGRLAPCINDLPEPASYALVIVALAGMGFAKRRRVR